MEYSLIYIVGEKLDRATRREWENIQDKDTFPTLEEFVHFLNKRCSLLKRLNFHQGNKIEDRRRFAKNITCTSTEADDELQTP